MSDDFDDRPWAWLGYALGLVGALLFVVALVTAGLLLAGLL